MLEILENAGASVLGAGNHMPPAEVVRILNDYHANVLSGDSSQILGIVHYISSLPLEERASLAIRKIIYTSEALTTAQRTHILAVLGPVSICSILGSAEAGPYGASNPGITGTHPSAGSEDFIFDTRVTLFEIFPQSFSVQGSDPDPVPEEREGDYRTNVPFASAESSYALHNPATLVASPLPEQARDVIPKAHWPYLRILRFRGRDRRFSFEWDRE